MPSSPEENQLDDPLYGDFEDYLDGVLPEARLREVEALLARSATARALLEELRTARAWLNGTTWDVPEPTRWPSAEEILARAGRRPAATSATRRWWARWSLNVRSPVWALGAAAGLALLMGGGLWWWLLPPASDETAQSSRAQDAVIESQDGPPSSAVPLAAPAVESVESAPPVRPQNGVAAPGDAAQKEARQKDAPETSRPAVAPPAPTQASPGASVERIYPRVPLLGQAESPPPPAAPPSAVAPDEPQLLAGRDLPDRSEASSPAADAAGARPEAQRETLKEDSGYAAAPPAPAARRSDASPGERARASASGVDASSPVTLRLVVADRARAVEQATAVARAFGGTARFGGDRLIITVPAARIADCAARLRARIPQAAEGRPLLLTVRARE